MAATATPERVTTTAADLHARWANGETVCVIDVRTPAEYQTVHIPPAQLAPLDTLRPEHAAAFRADAAASLYIVCKSGARAKQACDRLERAGVENLVLDEDGTDAWVQAGYPAERGKAVMSLERQVRIAAGSIVFVGVLLGVFVEPWLLIIPGFVGAGLVFAGVTDTCAMGMLIAKLPWNRGAASGGA